MHRRLLLETAESATTVVATAETTTMSKSANATGADAELSQANFDTNMIIILAALLCALICALGLTSVIQCVLRCSRRETEEEEEAARVSGLKKSVLRKIPVFVYDGRDHKGGGSREEECPICLGEFVDGDKVRVLPKCNHGFHVSCIDTWLGEHSSCPNCRHSVADAARGGLSKVPMVSGRGGVGVGEGRVVVEMSTMGIGVSME